MPTAFFGKLHYIALNALLAVTEFHSKPCPGVCVPSLLAYDTGEHPHHSLFHPINNGQWYVASLTLTRSMTESKLTSRFALGYTPGKSGGGTLFGPSLLQPWLLFGIG